MQNISVPDYYSKFSCIGAKCEDTCCSGWTVGIDRDTYKTYEQSTNPLLAPRFKSVLRLNTAPQADEQTAFGSLKMRANGDCHFLQEDKLCAIHKALGEQALSHTCRTFPRYLNRFGSQRENALGISCPEAARLILLNPDPMQFSMLAPDPAFDGRPFTSFRFPQKNDGDARQIAVLNDFRALIILILQCRDISLGARLMTLGFLLEAADRIVSSEQFSDADELLPALAYGANLLARPAQLEAQFDQIPSNTPRKLDILTQLMAQSLTIGASPRFNECLLWAAQGLETGTVGVDLFHRYALSRQDHYQPFFQDRTHIFENYLVNQVITRLFPFTRGSYQELYHEMVFNLSILQVMLVGMAAHHRGLNEALVIQLFQSYARKSDHSRHHLDTLLKAVPAHGQDAFAQVMWLLKDTPP